MRRLLNRIPFGAMQEMFVVIGSFLGLEAGDRLLLEDGGRIKLEE